MAGGPVISDMNGYDHQDDGHDDYDVEVGSVPYADELRFLTVDYLSERMKYDTPKERLVLDLSGQYPLFDKYLRLQKRQKDPHDGDDDGVAAAYVSNGDSNGNWRSPPTPNNKTNITLQDAFIERMVFCMQHHPLGEEVKHLDLARSGCGDDFVVELCRVAVSHPATFLPNLQVLDLETNDLSDVGLLAVAHALDPGGGSIGRCGTGGNGRCVGDGRGGTTPTGPVGPLPPWRDLRELRLNNNRRHGIVVERAFRDALCLVRPSHQHQQQQQQRQNGGGRSRVHDDDVGHNGEGDGTTSSVAPNTPVPPVSMLTKLNLEFRDVRCREAVHGVLFRNLDAATRQARLCRRRMAASEGRDDEASSVLRTDGDGAHNGKSVPPTTPTRAEQEVEEQQESTTSSTTTLSSLVCGCFHWDRPSLLSLPSSPSLMLLSPFSRRGRPSQESIGKTK
jgi:hypothetical protein